MNVELFFGLIINKINRNVMYYEVGEIFKYGGRKVKCIRKDYNNENPCKNCFFHLNRKSCVHIACGEAVRMDRQNVFFVEVDNNENNKISNIGIMENLHLKPFNIEEAKQGKPVYTRGGKPARVISYDAKSGEHTKNLIVLIECGKEYEEIERYTLNGKYYIDDESEKDLMIVADKKIGYANICLKDLYPTEEDAINNSDFFDGYITTVKVEYYE